jgi:hypothetical protein
MGAEQKSSKAGASRCDARTAQRAVPTQGNEEFSPAPVNNFVNNFGWHFFRRVV